MADDANAVANANTVADSTLNAPGNDAVLNPSGQTYNFVTLPNSKVPITNNDSTVSLPWRLFFAGLFERGGGASSAQPQAAVNTQIGSVATQAAEAEAKANEALALVLASNAASKAEPVLLTFGFQQPVEEALPTISTQVEETTYLTINNNLAEGQFDPTAALWSMMSVVAANMANGTIDSSF